MDISLLIKPASGNCNLRCGYCFYHSVAENRSVPSYGIMTLETAEALIRKTLDYSDRQCTFAFQGGEPTLAGLDFFRRFIELVKRYNTKKIRVSYALQTNGTLTDEAWAEFLVENDFLVGVSLDGPRDFHDLNRTDARGKGSFQRVMKTVQLFNRYKVRYNILSVITAQSARHADKLYNFFKENQFRYIQFINCLDPLEEERGLHPYSLKPEALSNFLKTIFDRWYEDFRKGDYISVRYFDNLVMMLLGHPPEACNQSGICRCQYVIEADGGIYPCDFYVLDQWYLGNINEMPLEDIPKSGILSKFVEASLAAAPECKGCKWYALCRGGCRRERENSGETGETGQKTGKTDDKIGPGLNYYCKSYQEFFEYAYPRLMDVAGMVANNT